MLKLDFYLHENVYILQKKEKILKHIKPRCETFAYI